MSPWGGPCDDGNDRGSVTDPVQTQTEQNRTIPEQPKTTKQPPHKPRKTIRAMHRDGGHPAEQKLRSRPRPNLKTVFTNNLNVHFCTCVPPKPLFANVFVHLLVL